MQFSVNNNGKSISGTQSLQTLPPKDSVNSAAGGTVLSSLTGGAGSVSQSKLPHHSVNLNSGLAFMQQQNHLKNQMIRSNMDTIHLLANMHRQTS